MRLVVFTLFLGLVAALPVKAEKEKGYVGFAAESERGPVSGSVCRTYGGQPVVDQLHGVVMNMGRRDSKRTNILYYGGHQYVAFSIQNTTFWGKTETAIALCHFAG